MTATNNHHENSATSLDMNDLLLTSTNMETEEKDVLEQRKDAGVVALEPPMRRRKSIRTTTTPNGMVVLSGGTGTTGRNHSVGRNHYSKSPMKQRITATTNNNVHITNNLISNSPKICITKRKYRKVKPDGSSSTAAFLQKLQDLQQQPEQPDSSINASGDGLDLHRSIRW